MKYISVFVDMCLSIFPYRIVFAYLIITLVTECTGFGDLCSASTPLNPYDTFQSVFRCSRVIIVLFVSSRPPLMRRFPREGVRELTNNCFRFTRNWIRGTKAVPQCTKAQHPCNNYPHDVNIPSKNIMQPYLKMLFFWGFVQNPTNEVDVV